MTITARVICGEPYCHVTITKECETEKEADEFCRDYEGWRCLIHGKHPHDIYGDISYCVAILDENGNELTDLDMKG